MIPPRLVSFVAILLFMTGPSVGLRPSAQAQPVSTETYLQGIDVSHYQGLVNWKRVKEAGYSFAIAKATGGTRFVDSQFHNNWQGMREAGLVRGAYHFFHADEDPIAQAEHFIQTVSTLRPGDLPPIVDIEVTENIPTPTIVARALVWIKYVEEKLGKKPMVYSSLSFYNRYLATDFINYHFWVAEYSNRIEEPRVDRSWEMWQHSQSGSVPGINGDVDLNFFNGTMVQLRAFLRDSSTQPAVTPPAAQPAATPPAAQPAATPTRTHVVKPGENLYRIALRYKTTIAAIAAANGITNPARIHAGQVLKIP